MGAWGTGLYSDDFALDVKNDLLAAINDGKSCRTAIEELGRKYEVYTHNDNPDIPVFWFVCADVLWRKGRLEDDVKQITLSYIDSGVDVMRWAVESPSMARRRKAVLEKLRSRLLSPQPEAKPIRIKRLYVCPWNIGDVYAIVLTSDFAKEAGFEGTYALFQMAEKMFIETYGTYPIVRSMLTQSMSKPKLGDFCGEKILLSRWPEKDVYANILVYLNTRNTKNVLYLGNMQIVEKENDYGIHLENDLDCSNKLGMTDWLNFPDRLIRTHLKMFRS